MGNYFSSSDTLQEIQQLCGTRQDEMLSNEKFIADQERFTEANNNLEFVKTVTLRPTHKGSTTVFSLPNSSCYNSFGHFLKNLKISSVDGVESCSLKVGDNTIEKIDTDLFPVLRQLFNIDDDQIVPFSFCKPGCVQYMISLVEQTVVIESDKPVTLTVDVYKTSTEPKEPLSLFYKMTDVQVTDRLSVSGNKLAYTTDFHNVVQYILIKTSNNSLDKLNFTFCTLEKDVVLEFDPAHLNTINGYYVVPFSDGVSFSKYPVVMNFELAHFDTDLSMAAVGLNIGISVSGLFTLRYCR